MSAGYPYPFDKISGERPKFAMEIPFVVRSESTSFEDFKEIAERDLGIIKQFVRKACIKQAIIPGIIDTILAQAVVVECTDAVWIRSFFSADDETALETVVGKLYDECLGNLPASFQKGGLKIGETLHLTKRPRVRTMREELEDLEREISGYRGDAGRGHHVRQNTPAPAVEEAVPNPD